MQRYGNGRMYWKYRNLLASNNDDFQFTNTDGTVVIFEMILTLFYKMFCKIIVGNFSPQQIFHTQCFRLRNEVCIIAVIYINRFAYLKMSFIYLFYLQNRAIDSSHIDFDIIVESERKFAIRRDYRILSTFFSKQIILESEIWNLFITLRMIIDNGTVSLAHTISDKILLKCIIVNDTIPC